MWDISDRERWIERLLGHEVVVVPMQIPDDSERGYLYGRVRLWGKAGEYKCSFEHH